MKKSERGKEKLNAVNEKRDEQVKSASRALCITLPPFPDTLSFLFALVQCPFSALPAAAAAAAAATVVRLMHHSRF